MAEKASLGFNNAAESDGDIDVAELGNLKRQKPDVDRKLVRAASEATGFTSRQAPPVRRRQRRSPYVEQKNYRIRDGVQLLLPAIAEEMALTDSEMFDEMLMLYLQKKELKSYREQLRKIIDGKQFDTQ